ncbi:uncharacterized protein LOC124368573 [Homalodisca vitripennis]|uniref:uncharacterized protein LOC124368573 n=1 Tax=Homalodisca vitripennis TaxID=197043 RepID=UPI001EEA25DA|nr:uncharacterized protein LOC124368573 [Homalodisca vitripennis]KAG8301074.1 hypothetical protein J6590_061500 [Homalodisca vitripennis]
MLGRRDTVLWCVHALTGQAIRYQDVLLNTINHEALDFDDILSGMTKFVWDMYSACVTLFIPWIVWCAVDELFLKEMDAADNFDAEEIALGLELYDFEVDELLERPCEE